MPLNGLGLRLAILLRRISTMRLEYPAGALDVLRWGMRQRNLLSCDPAKTAVARRVRSAAAAPEKGAQRIQTQPLLQLLQSERIDRLDAIKIDVDGCEDRILVPFFRSARRLLWPRLL
jgi:FkbM family methyltransferase